MFLNRRAFLKVGPGVAAALAGCSRAPDSSRPAENAEWEKNIANLEKRISNLMVELAVPGVSVAIVRDARVAWIKSFGVRDRSTGIPVDDDTIFSAQSMSKPVFAYRVMKLCEQGVLDLDAPLTTYTSDVFVKDDPRLLEIRRAVFFHTPRDYPIGVQEKTR